MYVPESNVMPFNGTVPPPGFESNMAFNTQNASYQYDSNNSPAPPVVNSRWNFTFFSKNTDIIFESKKMNSLA